MFGYATDETEECMPLTIILAHKLNARMADLRRSGVLPWLRPDSKTQVSLLLSLPPWSPDTPFQRPQALLIRVMIKIKMFSQDTQRIIDCEKNYLFENSSGLDVFSPNFFLL